MIIVDVLMIVTWCILIRSGIVVYQNAKFHYIECRGNGCPNTVRKQQLENEVYLNCARAKLFEIKTVSGSTDQIDWGCFD